MDAKEWFRRTEDLLIAAETEATKKVETVAYHLTDQASTSWQAELLRIMVKLVPWDTFKEKFFKMYFPAADKERFQTRFLEMKQRGRSVTEYKAEFTLLSMYNFNYSYFPFLSSPTT